MEGLLQVDPENSSGDVESTVPDSVLQNLLLKVQTLVTPDCPKIDQILFQPEELAPQQIGSQPLSKVVIPEAGMHTSPLGCLFFVCCCCCCCCLSLLLLLFSVYLLQDFAWKLWQTRRRKHSSTFANLSRCAVHLKISISSGDFVLLLLFFVVFPGASPQGDHWWAAGHFGGVRGCVSVSCAHQSGGTTYCHGQLWVLKNLLCNFF